MGCKDDSGITSGNSNVMLFFTSLGNILQSGRWNYSLFIFNKIDFLQTSHPLPINHCAAAAASSAGDCASWSVIIVFPHGLTEALVCEAKFKFKLDGVCSVFRPTCSEYLLSWKKTREQVDWL